MKQISEVLNANGFNTFLNPREFKDIKPWNADALCEYVEDIRKSSSAKVIIIPDTDVDGVISAKEMLDVLEVTTESQIDIFRHSYKMHGLTIPMLYDILKSGYTHVVIVDSSSNDMHELCWLSNKGIKVLVIDHHMPSYSLKDYPKNVTILNNKLCLKEGIRIPYREVSCGALVALYCNYLYAYFGFRMSNVYWAYAMITLYSDDMDLFDEFNIMIIAYARETGFMDNMIKGIADKKEVSLTREMLTYSISPKINACLKGNNFKPILDLFFSRDLTSSKQKELCLNINRFNGYIKTRLSEIESSLIPVIQGSVSLVDMTQFINDELIDFKGTIANKAAAQTGKLALAYYRKNGYCYVSVRDPLNRDALSILQEVCPAAGHKSACGFTVKEELLESIVRYASLSLEDVTTTRKNPVIIPVDEYDLTAEDIYQMSVVNEYAVNNGIFLKVTVKPELFKIDNYRGLYSVKSSRFMMTGNIPVNYGDTVLVVPTLGIKPKLRIKTIVRN